jgi:hypothetical protein
MRRTEVGDPSIVKTIDSKNGGKMTGEKHTMENMIDCR